jgi:hypothetical protein
VRGDNVSHYTISELAMNVTSTYSYTFLKSNLHTSGIRARGRSGEDAAQIFFEEHSCRMAIWRLGDRSRFSPVPALRVRRGRNSLEAQIRGLFGARVSLL